MPKVSEDMKNRISNVVTVAKTVFHYGYIPFVFYLGFKRGPDPGMPAFSLLSILTFGIVPAINQAA